MTSKPHATISYNTEPFLVEVLNRLYSAHKIQAWQYIWHKGEDGDKDHFHVRIEPNCSLDLMQVFELFREYPNGDKSGKPLCCRPFRYSKEEDWFLYAVHDQDYLALKYGKDYSIEDGKIPYEWQDIKCSDMYDVQTAFIRARASLRHSSASASARLSQGERALNLVGEGYNPSTLRNIQSLVNSEALPLAMREVQNLRAEYGRLERKLRRLLDALQDNGICAELNEDGFWNLKTAPSAEQGNFFDDNGVFVPF